MGRLLILAGIGLAAAAMGGCSIVPPTSDEPYPVYGNPVNPTPARGYRVECTSVPGLAYGVFNDFYTGCQQVILPVDPVVSARG